MNNTSEKFICSSMFAHDVNVCELSKNISNYESEWMAFNAKRIAELVKCACTNKVLKKIICDYTWISGSSTTVYPITIRNSGEIQIQVKGGKRANDFRLRGAINQIKIGFSDIVHDCYSDAETYDGSCPTVFTILLHNSFAAKCRRDAAA